MALKNKYIYPITLLFSSFKLFAQNIVLDSISNAPKEIRNIPTDFKKNYQGDDYTYEHTPGLWEQFIEWLISLFQKWFDAPRKTTLSIFDNLSTLFYILVILFVIYLIVKIIMNNEGRWVFGKNKTSKEITYKDVEQDISIVDFEELIENALENENYRLAIRYSYLWVLKKLDEKSIIEYNAEKTNVDYQYELEKTAYAESFKTASYYYSYVWYGEFFINKEAYSKAEKLYKNFLKQIGDVK